MHKHTPQPHYSWAARHEWDELARRERLEASVFIFGINMGLGAILAGLGLLVIICAPTY